jgi:hypothetical protein
MYLYVLLGCKGGWRVEIFNNVFGVVGVTPWSLDVAMVPPVKLWSLVVPVVPGPMALPP